MKSNDWPGVISVPAAGAEIVPAVWASVVAANRRATREEVATRRTLSMVLVGLFLGKDPKIWFVPFVTSSSLYTYLHAYDTPPADPGAFHEGS